MRRTVALILVAAGVFLAALAITFKSYVEPRAVRVPLDQTGQTLAVSDGASTVLDAGTLTVRQNLTLDARREVRGDVEAAQASKRSEDVAVWRTTNIVTDAQKNVVNVTSETVALDRRTGAAVNCCGEEVGGDAAVKHAGVFLKFPFDTRRTSYQFWDSTALRAFEMRFVGVESRGGLETYHFSQQVPATELRKVSVPGALVGADPAQVVDTTVVYTNTRDVWVEPVSGVIVHGQESPKQALFDPVGNEVLTAFQAKFGWTQQTQDKQLTLAEDTKGRLFMLRTVIPAGAGLLGLALLVVGLVLLAGAGRSRPDEATTVAPDADPAAPRTVDVAAAEADSGTGAERV